MTEKCFYGFWILKPPMFGIFNSESWRWHCNKEAEWRVTCKIARINNKNIKVNYYYCSKHLGKSLEKIVLKNKDEITSIKRIGGSHRKALNYQKRD